MRTRRRGRWLLKQPRLGARMCQGTFFFQGEKKMNKVRQLLKESLTGGLYQMTLSGATGEATGCSKKKIRPVLLKDRILFQITAYRGTQVFHENHTAEEAAAILEADLSGSFKQLQVETTFFEATVLISKKGKMTVNINVFDPVHLVSVMLFYYTLYFRKTITAFNENYNVVIKIVSLGLFLHTSLAFLPVLALRISQLYCIVNIFLFSGIVYTFKQKWMGITILVLLSIFQMYLALPHYGLGDIVRF